MIEHTNEMEKELKQGVTYMDCFKGVDIRRTEIVVGIWIVQTLGGQNLMGYFSYFLVQAGMDPGNSFSLSMGQYALGMVGTAGSWFLMAKVGRRKIHFSGLCCQCLILIIVGSLSFSKDNGAVWAIAAMLIIFTFVYDFTVGPVTYSLISELSSTRLKAKTIVLARAAYNASSKCPLPNAHYQELTEMERYHGQCVNQLPIVVDCVGLGRARGLLVGRNLSRGDRLGIFQAAGAEGPHVRRVGCAVREGRVGEEVCYDAH